MKLCLLEISESVAQSQEKLYDEASSSWLPKQDLNSGNVNEHAKKEHIFKK